MKIRRVTIKDVAARAGVAYQTVSKVINGQAHVLPETGARIWQAARELGYKPNHNARNLRAQRSRMIGYSWVTAKADQAHHVLDMFLTSMVEEAEAARYHLLPFPYRDGDEQIEAYRELIDTGKVDGFVISSVNYQDPRARFLLEQKFPFVAFGYAGPELDFPYVDVDGQAGLRQATEHLLTKGHRQIAVLAWPEESRVGNERLAGYLQAMETAALAVDPLWIARGEGTFAFGQTATERWLDLPAPQRPTALVAVTDTMAVGAMRAIQARGLSVGPDPARDLAVIGFDDAPLARYLWPPLTTIRQPIHEAGHKCAEILIALLEGKPLVERQVVLPPELIVRASA